MLHVIESTISTGCVMGKDVFIPRIPIIPTDMPFEFKRLQCISIKFKASLLRLLALTQRLALLFTWPTLSSPFKIWNLEEFCMYLPLMRKLKNCVSNKFAMKTLFQRTQSILNFLIYQGCNIEFSRPTPGTPAINNKNMRNNSQMKYFRLKLFNVIAPSAVPHNRNPRSIG